MSKPFDMYSNIKGLEMSMGREGRAEEMHEFDVQKAEAEVADIPIAQALRELQLLRARNPQAELVKHEGGLYLIDEAGNIEKTIIKPPGIKPSTITSGLKLTPDGWVPYTVTRDPITGGLVSETGGSIPGLPVEADMWPGIERTVNVQIPEISLKPADMYFLPPDLQRELYAKAPKVEQDRARLTNLLASLRGPQLDIDSSTYNPVDVTNIDNWPTDLRPVALMILERDPAYPKGPVSVETEEELYALLDRVRTGEYSVARAEARYAEPPTAEMTPDEIANNHLRRLGL